ncbi:bifunctional 4-hydroxy-2-oxoglutarate aldolase/2-dehydro-3-deoxy-phosphogluconate aldolase [Aurantivibrio infirmus]
MDSFTDLLTRLRILPVLTVNSAEEAIKVSQALQSGGLLGVEITLRTPAAVDAIQAVVEALPTFTVAAGTIVNPLDMEAVAKAGARFAVSPGMTDLLIDSAKINNIDFLPGVATPSEVLQGLEKGLRHFKLFPAEAVGGIPLLKSLASPFAGIKFCPTGGVNLYNLQSYLDLPNVICVGGSWMVPEDLIRASRWDDIEALAKKCTDYL